MSDMATLRILLILAFFGLRQADSKSSGSDRTFLHISDIHLDIHYIEGGDESKWCRQV